jgi:hypothetical protein
VLIVADFVALEGDTPPLESVITTVSLPITGDFPGYEYIMAIFYLYLC